jgi:predicted RNA-binding protein YlqC (UPF0109 family)
VAFSMANIETNFADRRNTDVVSDVTTDVNVTLSDVGTQKNVIVQLPIGLPLDKLHQGYKKNKRRGTDLNAYFIGHLVKRNQFRRKPINEYVPMNSKVLRDVFGGNYAKYIKRLIDEGIIEQYSRPTKIPRYDGTFWEHNGTYSVSAGISKQYKLLVAEETALVDYTITDKHLIKKLNNVRVKRLEYTIKNSETARKVYESIKELTIDKAAALNFIKKEYQFEKMKGWAQWFIGRDGYTAKSLKTFIREFECAKNKEDKIKVLSKYGIEQSMSAVDLYEAAVTYTKLYAQFKSRLHWIRVIDAIQQGKHSLISMTQDKYSGRIYHTFTMTAGNLRPFLKLNGEHLVEFDAANCQWMLFIKLCNILCKPSFYDKYIEDLGIKGTKQNTNTPTHDTATLSMLHSFFSENKSKIEKEVYKLRGCLTQNKLRSMIVEAEAKRGVVITEAKAKQFLIANVLFGNPDGKGYNNYKSVQTFKKEFPTLSDIILKLKRYWINEAKYGYKPKDIYGRSLRYKAFPRLLQKMESDVFVKGMKDISSSFLTLHDAVVTNASGTVEVKNMLDKIIKENNVEIKLKFKEYV